MMPAKSFLWVVFIGVVSVRLERAAAAQTSPACITLMGGVAMTYPPMSMENTAYTATVKMSHEQKLADGNAIHTSVTARQARDSAGRTWEESSIGCGILPDGTREPVSRFTVYDPATRTTMFWQVGGQSQKVVQVMHQPEARPVPPPSPEVMKRQVAANRQEMARTGSRSEKLGSRSIGGVLCDGTRTVRTIPTGEEGNDLPIEEVNELWIAHDLRLVMLNVNDDPRTGRNTTEVVELDQGEPDASLFAPPAGYTLQEQSTKVLTSAGSEAQ